MIRFENIEVVGLEAAIRGMRNPMNSWGKTDSEYCGVPDENYSICEWRHMNNCYNGYVIGPNDHELMMKLAKGGPVHAKYRRMIAVYVDIVAPLYWWKEFDTYKVGTVANSCSTMHKIHEKEFTMDDFSCEHLLDISELWNESKFEILPQVPMDILESIIRCLNCYRERFLETKDIKYWWQMIQLLPSSYNQRRTVMLNYEVLTGIYHSRKKHKLDEWWNFCDWIEDLPYSEVITRYDNTGENK
jgi:hypothetical protein